MNFEKRIWLNYCFLKALVGSKGRNQIGIRLDKTSAFIFFYDTNTEMVSAANSIALPYFSAIHA